MLTVFAFSMLIVIIKTRRQFTSHKNNMVGNFSMRYKLVKSKILQKVEKRQLKLQFVE